MSPGKQACRLCLEAKKFAKSHVIPRSFFLKIKGDFKYAFEVNLDAKRISTFRQAGNYDQRILCIECERRFNDLDSYGFAVLENPDVSRPIFRHGISGTVEAYHVVGLDTDKLRKFVLSVLWRASVSSLDYYDYVRLGPVFEDEVIEKVFNPAVLPWDEFTMLVLRVDEGALGPFSKVMLPPLPHRDVSGLKCYTLYLPGVKVIVKMDHRPTPADWWASAIQHPSQLTMLRAYGGLLRNEWAFVGHLAERVRREKLVL